MHLDEVERVVGELVGYLVPLHGWSAGTVARPASGEREQGGEGEEEGWWEREEITCEAVGGRESSNEKTATLTVVK